MPGGSLNLVSRGLAAALVRAMAGRRGGPERSVDPARFGVRVKDPVCLERIRAILTAFFSGFECGLAAPEELGARARAAGPLLAPFFHEGFAMGLLPNGCLRLRRSRTTLEGFERAFGEEDPFVFLRYVGLGFWLGFRHPRSPGGLERAAARLRAAKYRPLLHDGYGFKAGFFGGAQAAPGEASRELAPLLLLDGFARSSAMNGLGRSLWFQCMDRPEAGAAFARQLGPDRGAVLGGLGLAAAFTFADDLSRAYAAADGLAQEERPCFVKGMRIALYVRANADRGHLDGCLEALPPALGARAAADLERALRVGKETRAGEDFIEAFHAGCLGD